MKSDTTDDIDGEVQMRNRIRKISEKIEIKETAPEKKNKNQT